MSHFTSTKPFFILQGVPNARGFVYSANEVGADVDCDAAYTFTEYDTETELANAVDVLIGESGWYWKCENRVPYPPNPNIWSYTDCVQDTIDTDPEPEPEE